MFLDCGMSLLPEMSGHCEVSLYISWLGQEYQNGTHGGGNAIYCWYTEVLE